jgi:hypothetical protein
MQKIDETINSLRKYETSSSYTLLPCRETEDSKSPLTPKGQNWQMSLKYFFIEKFRSRITFILLELISLHYMNILLQLSYLNSKKSYFVPKQKSFQFSNNYSSNI